MNGLFPPSAPCPLWDRALSVSRWGHRTLRGAIFSHCLRRGAHRAPAGLPPAAPILPGQARRGDWVWSTTRAGRGRHAQGPASPISGGRRKADCGTQAERMWSRGPAGSVTRRRFAAGGKVSRPAGRNPLEAETVGRREAPSSVTASAVTPSPLWGEGFECASRGRPCAENPALSRQHRTMTSA